MVEVVGNAGGYVNSAEELLLVPYFISSSSCQ
jgi:hypothetical protein